MHQGETGQEEDPRGKHKVRANYKGSKTVKKSKTKKAVTLRVLRAK
ncbi:hypothetical protein SAMN06309944_1243 [Micrococcales bacterium KH10]|nr:hypothetical protein SAMN06309944_1243 [Micrococcales bacterium KH10]